MAAPLVPILFMIGRSVGLAMRRWQGIVAVIGLIFASGFTFNAMLRQMGDTAITLWPLLVIICFTFLVKEVVRAWFKIRQSEVGKKEVEK